MDDSGHKGNTGQLLNSRVLGVLSVISLFITQVSVFQSQSKLIPNHLIHVLIQHSFIASNRCVGVLNEIASKHCVREVIN